MLKIEVGMIFLGPGVSEKSGKVKRAERRYPLT